jgi:methyl-accepting chemotaxis protein
MTRMWTFGRKLQVGLAIQAGLTLVLGVISYWALQGIVAEKDRIIHDVSERLVDAQLIRTTMSDESSNLRGFLLTGADRFPEQIAGARKALSSALEDLKRRDLAAAEAPLIATIDRARSEYDQQLDDILSMRRGSAQLQQVADAFEDRVVPKFTALSDAVVGFASFEREALATERLRSDEAAARATTLVIGIALLAVVSAAIAALLLTRGLTRQIGASIQHVRGSSAELQAAASQQAAGAKEQATAMREITTTITELLVTSRQIAESAQAVSKIAASTAEGAREGDETVRRAQDAVTSIRQQVDGIVRHMLELGKKSQQIGGILEIINELSEQTNILSINATIEAAGAGEAGRRFAVVGEEIRRLADRVGASTKETRGLIDEIRAAVNATVMATEAGSKTVDAGAQRFAEMATAFVRIGQMVETTTEAAREIELSTKQQTTAVEQVNVAISSAAQATRETEASSGQTLQTASLLASVSDDLARLVDSRLAAGGRT